MNRDEITETVLRCLCEVAPEVDPAQVKHDVTFRDQLDVDSMDLLNFVIAMHEQLHVDIPESEYGRLCKRGSEASSQTGLRLARVDPHVRG
jgi:acyl carrier protein